MKISVTQQLPKASTSRCLLLERVKNLTLLFSSLLLFVLHASAQNSILVRGHITNERNQPVVNASVTMKNSPVGTATDAAGNFELAVPANATLVVSSVGYAAKEIAVNGQ